MKTVRLTLPGRTHSTPPAAKVTRVTMPPRGGYPADPEHPKAHARTLVLPDDLYATAERYCAEHGITISLFVTALIERELREFIAEGETRWEATPAVPAPVALMNKGEMVKNGRRSTISMTESENDFVRSEAEALGMSESGFFRFVLGFYRAHEDEARLLAFPVPARVTMALLAEGRRQERSVAE